MSDSEHPPHPSQPVTLAVIGAGARGNDYANWALGNPDRARVVAVAEPIDVRREAFAERHGIPPEAVFRSWEELAAADRLADAAIVATQDADHLAPAVTLARHGYHLLLEKPLAPTEEECRELVHEVQRTGVMFAVCHVLRYTAYTRLLKEVIDSGRIGKIMSVQHLEPVGYWHQAHSFVRGNWRRTDESSFMLLAKSCHDFDWLRYVVGVPFKRVSSFGHLTHFRPEDRPEGAAHRCLDCAIEPDCAYSAKRHYLGRLRGGDRGWAVRVLTADLTEEGLTRALREGPYGRCVYACDNDVVDHQVAAIEFEGGVTGTFTMTAFTEQTDRRTQIFGTKGSIDADGEHISIYDFRSEKTEVLSVAAHAPGISGGHGGGDSGTMNAFVTAVATGDPTFIQSGPLESLETHLAVFAAERARLTGSVETVELPHPAS
jgi:predicted dehydrogenase